MNELMIVLEGGNWLYFKTRQVTTDKALTDFLETCNDVGINTDNIQITRMVLRDEQENDIEEAFF